MKGRLPRLLGPFLVSAAGAGLVAGAMTLTPGRTDAVDGGSDRVVIPEVAADGPAR